MFVILTLALVCTAAASSGYGAPANDAPSYSGQQYGGYNGGHGYYHRSRSSSSSSSEERHGRKCRKLGELNTAPFTGHKAEISPLERKGRDYIKISCPNDGKDYALLADKQGSLSSANAGADSVANSILLAAGVNIDFVARCSGRRVHATANNGEKVRIRDVYCVSLNTTPDAF